MNVVYVEYFELNHIDWLCDWIRSGTQNLGRQNHPLPNND